MSYAVIRAFSTSCIIFFFLKEQMREKETKKSISNEENRGSYYTVLEILQMLQVHFQYFFKSNKESQKQDSYDAHTDVENLTQGT